jgi:hypothetical protein
LRSGRWIALHVAAFAGADLLTRLWPVGVAYGSFRAYLPLIALPWALAFAGAQVWGGAPVRGVRGFVATAIGLLLGFAIAWTYTMGLQRVTWDEEMSRGLGEVLNAVLTLLGQFSTGLFLAAAQAVAVKERRLLWFGVAALSWTLSSALISLPEWLRLEDSLAFLGSATAPVLRGVQGLAFALLELPWLKRWPNDRAAAP